jgi:hypothetical protein
MQRYLTFSLVVALALVSGCQCGSRTPRPASVPDAAPPVPEAARALIPTDAGTPPAASDADAAFEPVPLPNFGPIDSSPITAASKAPWIAQALRIGGKLYALRNPTKSGRPADTERPEDDQLEIYQNIFMSKSRPVKGGGRVTLVDEVSTCAGTVTGEVDVYMACNWEMEQGQYTKRTGLIIGGCREMERDEDPYRVIFWAVEGAHPGTKLWPTPRAELAESERDGLLKTVKTYAESQKLPEASADRLDLVSQTALPGTSTRLLKIYGSDFERLMLINGTKVIRHFPERFNVRHLMVVDGRLFVAVSTELECGNVYTLQGTDLVAYNDDCLYLWCGDGLE